jgi:tRNA 2-selenouridine synthase
MISEIGIEEYFKSFEKVPLIDVRSPSEFSKGHIPGSNSIPLFSDEERAHIGTVYLKQSQEEALKLGYDYANPKSEYFISGSKSVAPHNIAAVHCWRGGMRSHTFAEHLQSNGFKEVYVIKGGYKAYRNYVLDSFNEDCSLFILGGYTGSGKTEILKFLKAEGMQVIDLEEIAHHKGSAFGGIGNTAQPTYEQFENNLFFQLQQLDHTKPIWLEDESIKIGSVQIPNSFYKKMYEASVFFLEIPREERAKFLTAEYASCDKAALATALKKISKRLGDENTRNALEFLENNNYYEVAMTTLNYYDKAYREVLSGRDQKFVYTINLKNTDHQKNTKIIKDFFESKIYE